MGFAEELRKTQDKDWIEFEKILLDFIKKDIQARASKGHDNCCVKLGFLVDVVIPDAIVDGDLDETAEETFMKVRELFYVVETGWSNDKETYGPQPKTVDKLSDFLVTEFEKEGFKVTVSKEACDVQIPYSIPWSHEEGEKPITMTMTISW